MSNPWSNPFKEIRYSNFEIEDPYTSIEEKKNYSPSRDKDNDGDNDFADNMIARMVASGMSEKEASEKVKNKSYNKKSKTIDVMPSGEKNSVKINPEVNEATSIEMGEKFDITKQSSKRKSLGRKSSIKDGSKPTGYESPKEFRDAEKKFSKKTYSEEFGNWVNSLIDEGCNISEYTLMEMVKIFESEHS